MVSASPFYDHASHQTLYHKPFSLSPHVNCSLSLKNYMSLLTPSESLAFNGFLSAVSSVDYGDVYEWGTLTTSLADHLPPARGREALSRATKDLMALEAIHDNNDDPKPVPTRPSTSSHQQPVWPTFGLGPAPPSRDSSSASTATTTDRSPQQQQNYTYGFALPRAHSNSVSRPVNPYNTDGSSIPSHLPLPFPHPHSESSLRHRPLSHSPSPFVLPTIHDNSPLQSQPQPHTPTSFASPRPPPISSVSAPSVLLHRTVSASAVPTLSSKRPFPSDGNSDFDIVAKRRRSATNPASIDVKPTLSIPHRPPSSSSSSIAATPTSQYPDFSPTLASFSATRSSPVTPRTAQSIAPPPARQALLSPSQKRANHIQSEQKRRANIRRGYEALCEAVPALREAIRLEEAGLGRASSIGADEKSSLSQVGKTVSKKKKKGKAGSDDGEKPIDGRAGPRSENVVLSKTIAYIQALMEERTNLTQRLTYARSALSHSSLNNHSQILQVSPANLDDKGVPLWEREWSGGTGWAEISGCDADDAEGEGDEEDGE